MSEREETRIGFVGSGVMAEVMISGLLARGVTPPGHIWASGPREERAEELRARYGIQATTDNLE
ncbi:MAG TPA: NAD(P)-binding domain-containing protein, partial [Thermoanaerobaculia bacterium]|nr:NAD(P)-binding domain-containing protein [Thermoanaerobaculia bacterium]